MQSRPKRHGLWPFLLPLALFAAAPLARGQSEEASPPGEAGWTGQANLNLAGSYGNAGSGSLGLSAGAARETGRLRVALEGGLLRTSTDLITRQAFGSPDDFSVDRTVTSQTSADRSHFRVRVAESSRGERRGGSQVFCRHRVGAGRPRRRHLAVRLHRGGGEGLGRGSRRRTAPFRSGSGTLGGPPAR